jgi:hypothetical protein
VALTLPSAGPDVPALDPRCWNGSEHVDRDADGLRRPVAQQPRQPGDARADPEARLDHDQGRTNLQFARSGTLDMGEPPGYRTAHPPRLRLHEAAALMSPSPPVASGPPRRRGVGVSVRAVGRDRARHVW